MSRIPAPSAPAGAVDPRELHQLVHGGLSREFVVDIVVSAVLPWLTAFLLQRDGVPAVTALSIAAVFPFALTVFSFARRRRLEPIATLNLAFLIAGIGVTVSSGDVHAVVIRNTPLTAGFSLMCLGSLAAPRPLMFYLARQFAARNDPALEARWNARWEHPSFRRSLRLITFVWGVGYLIEAALRVLIAYRFPPVVAIGLSSVLTYGAIFLLVAWTLVYAAMSRRTAVYD